jgi:DNA-binding transcriptional LysR family regulator
MALGGVDLNLLAVLQALLEERSVTRAGMRAGMPRPAMSRALARLRRHYQDELLVRGGNGYTLTPLGRSLLPSVQASMRAVEEVFSSKALTAVLSDYSAVVLGELLVRRARELAPGMRLNIRRIAPHPPDGSGRLAGQHDLLIAPLGFYRPRGRPEVICRDRFVCIADPANPRLRDGRLSLDDLHRMPHAVAKLPQAVTDPVRAVLEHAGVAPHVAVTTDGWLPVPFVVAGTDMVGVVPQRLARCFEGAAGVVVTEPPFGEIELAEAVWWPAGHAAGPALAWLCDSVRESAAGQPAITLADLAERNCLAALPGSVRRSLTGDILPPGAAGAGQLVPAPGNPPGRVPCDGDGRGGTGRVLRACAGNPVAGWDRMRSPR